MDRVLQTFPIPAAVEQKLRAHCEVSQAFFVEGDELVAAARGCRGVVAGTELWPREALAAVRGDLRAISRVGTGVDSVDVAAATEFGIAVLNAPGENAQTIAELSVGLMWSLARRMVLADQAVRTTGFKMRTELDGIELTGKTVGIIGFGEIGRRVAAICRHGFQMRVLITTARPDPARLTAAGIEGQFVELDELLAESDFVALHAAVTPETEHMIGSAQLQAMKDGTYLVNTARGQLVDEVALVDALKSGGIAGYGTDVYEVEPPPSDHPLFALPNTVLGPHFGSGTFESMTRMGGRAVDNLIEFLAGGQPERTVNPEVYSSD